MQPLEMHRRAQAEFARILDQVTDDELTALTPCDEWTVADLIEHAIEGNQYAAVRLGAPEETLPDGGRSERYQLAAGRADAAFSEPGALERTVDLPFGEVPANVFVAIRAGDLYAHAWDLATAIGVDADLDREVGEAVHAATSPVLPPGLRGEGRPFAPEQPCSADRPIADRYAAFVGRTVHD